ncbi:lasso RiPP family leader peptide-containing protein [Smaragdicoccus niigatensis]|nr:lasso RiPP family leader peptide-containing protein [Smaragdicoccus niigatensis]
MRETYSAPKLVDLGSVRELTLAPKPKLGSKQDASNQRLS